MNCDKFHDTGYRPSTKIICGCLDMDERANLVTLHLSRDDAKTLLDFAEACSFDVDIGLPGKIRNALGLTKNPITPEKVIAKCASDTLKSDFLTFCKAHGIREPQIMVLESGKLSVTWHGKYLMFVDEYIAFGNICYPWHRGFTGSHHADTRKQENAQAAAAIKAHIGQEG